MHSTEVRYSRALYSTVLHGTVEDPKPRYSTSYVTYIRTEVQYDVWLQTVQYDVA